MTSSERLQEEHLVLGCQLGEPEAFRQLVATMEPRLLYYVRRFVGDDDTAFDVLQEIWVEVFRKIKGLRSTAAFRAWLYRIAHDAAISYVRRELAQTRSEQIYAEDQPQASDEDAWAQADAAILHQMIGRLSLPHREVITLYFLEDMSYEEIAHSTGASLGTVKSRLYYAKRELRRLLEEPDHA